MEDRKETARFCGNILVRKTKKRSFLPKTLFEGVFGVLAASSFEYYQNAAQWTNSEKPLFNIKVLNIQCVEEVDDIAFGQSLCFQITFLSRTKKDNNKSRTIYLAAYDDEEFRLWLSSLRLACTDNPVFLTSYHSGRFTGKEWFCCPATTFRDSPGCKICTIYGIPEIKKLKLSPAIAFRGFGVIARESHSSDLPGSLPFDSGDHLTVSDASGTFEWKAFSTTSTSGYGYIPKDSVKMKNLEEEPWFFGEIPTALTTAILRDQVPGCFLLRSSGNGSRTFLSFRTERLVKHVEVLQDKTTQRFSVKDESDALSYANFLQFDSIQQLLDQCKLHPTLGITLEKYPPLKNADEIWKLDWGEIETKREHTSSGLPWTVFDGKLQDKHVLVHVLPEGCSDLLKERLCNQSRLLMTLNHENVIRLLGMGTTGPRNFMIQENLPKGDLHDYLQNNSSLLRKHPKELRQMINHVINGMVYLSESGVVHNELVTKNCLVGEKGLIKISGFHCARSPWCKRPLGNDEYKSIVPIPAPEIASNREGDTKSDVWSYGLLMYVIATIGQRPIFTLKQVLKCEGKEESLDQLGNMNFRDAIALCLQDDPQARPSFYDLRTQVSMSAASSTPSCSSYSLEGSVSAQRLSEETTTTSSDDWTPRIPERTSNSPERDTPGMDWDDSDITPSYSTKEIIHRLRNAELAALKAKALQKRAEAEKETILTQVQQAETKCLKEVEMMTKTFLVRLNEANDRAAEAEQARYLAQEVKRLTEEKYTLYKYESEKNMHDLKSMFDDALLERDELLAALKTVGKDLDARTLIAPRRRDSIRNLEDKYQRYISTSDRTIQSLKTQLSSVVKQRDQLCLDRESAKTEVKDTRQALEQAIKDKEEVRRRLEEAHFEIERLEEMISTMTQKRQLAERERDQLQMLTDMSLMKLRHVESGIPKKKVSLCSFPPKSDDRPKEKQDSNLRRLSQQLFHLMAPTPRQRAFKCDESDIVESSEESTSEGTFSSCKVSEDDQTPELPRRRAGQVVMSPIHRERDEMTTTTGTEEDPPEAGNVMKTVIRPVSPHRFIHINYFQPNENKTNQDQFTPDICDANDHQSERCYHDEESDSNGHDKEQLMTDLRRFVIPTLHIEEADTSLDAETESDGNDSTSLEQDIDQEDKESRPMFIIGGQDGQTRVVYSFEDLSELLEGIPQTTL